MIDDEATLYLRTDDGSTGRRWLYAVTRDGVVLYDRGDPFIFWGGVLVEDGVLVGAAGDRVRALDASTGVMIWEQKLADVVGWVGVDVSVGDELWSPRPGEVSVIAQGNSSGSDHGPLWRITFDSITGAVIRVVSHGEDVGFALRGGFSDEFGNTYFSFARASRDGPARSTTAAEDATGAMLWRATDLNLVRAIPSRGRLVSGTTSHTGCLSLDGRSASQGALLFRRTDLSIWAEGYGREPSLRSAGDAFFAAADLARDPMSCGPLGAQSVLMRFDPKDGSTLWSIPIERTDLRGELIPTDSGTLLFSDYEPERYTYVLRSVDFDGHERWRCDLPPNVGRLVGLHEGRAFFIQYSRGIAAVDLPGLSLAKHGWVNEFGDPAHRRRPR